MVPVRVPFRSNHASSRARGDDPDESTRRAEAVNKLRPLGVVPTPVASVAAASSEWTGRVVHPVREQRFIAHDEQMPGHDLAVSRGCRQVAFFAIVDEAHGATPVLAYCRVDEVHPVPGADREHVSAVAGAQGRRVVCRAVAEPPDRACRLRRKENRTVRKPCRARR